jgi:uncharacterized protein (TIGR02646 family)
MRPVLKNSGPGIIPKDYKKYRAYLTDNLGYYCSYCERRIEHGIGVEHVKPKTLYEDLELEWKNLLIACVNCNSTKGHKDIVLSEFYWPHLDNTAKAFQYSTGGIVRIDAQLLPRQRLRAQNMIDLVGLDKVPSTNIADNPEESDNRWKFRLLAWNKAEELKNDLMQDDTEKMRRMIIDIAEATGYFSVWMSVFQSDLKMRKSLVEAFKGTDINCYDSSTMSYLSRGHL